MSPILRISAKPAAIVCDVEGCTTSARFWSQVLAPFIADNVRPCLTKWWRRTETQDVLALLRERSFIDWRDLCDPNCPVILDTERECPAAVIDSATANVRYQLATRKHNDELKSLFLLVWLYGYEKQLLRSHVYGDVASSFRRWTDANHDIRLFTYASGSTLAQQMLFARTLHGNLVPYIECFLDSDTFGPKTHTGSFRKVARMIGEPPSRIMFISDSLEELRPAKLAGFMPILVIRTHNRHLVQQQQEESSPSSSSKMVGKIPFFHIESFDDLIFENCVTAPISPESAPDEIRHREEENDADVQPQQQQGLKTHFENLPLVRTAEELDDLLHLLQIN